MPAPCREANDYGSECVVSLVRKFAALLVRATALMNKVCISNLMVWPTLHQLRIAKGQAINVSIGSDALHVPVHNEFP